MKEGINIKKNKIYLIQMHTNTIPARIIKLLTRYKYSHVGLSFDRDCENIYSFGRKYVHIFIPGGFKIENKRGPFFKKFNKTKCRIFELEVTNEQYKSIKRILKDIEANQEKYSYDYIGLVLRFLNIPISFNNKYVCSYFIADVLEKSNTYKFNKKTCYIRPKDFEYIDGINEIYHGNIQNA